MMRFPKFLIIISFVLPIFSCTSKPKVVYKEKIIYKTSCPNITFPKQPKLNVYKIEYKNSIYYCFDKDDAKALSIYLLQIKDLKETYDILIKEGGK